MRGIIGVRLQNPTISNATRNTLTQFSTSSGFGGGGGRGGGRGRGGFGLGGPFGVNERAPGKPSSGDPKSEAPEAPAPPPPISGRGHGRGRPADPPSGMPSFSSFMSSIKQPSAGRGRGGPLLSHIQQDSQQQPDSEPKKSIFFKREEEDGAGTGASSDVSPPKAPSLSSSDVESDQKNLPGGILGVLSGTGRGKPEKQPDPIAQGSQENRHIRTQRAPGIGGGDLRAPAAATAAALSDSVPKRQPTQSVDDAVNAARRILLQKDNGDGSGRGRGRRGFDQGRGGGRGREGFRVWDLEERGGRDKDEKASPIGLFHGDDDADGERFAKRVGPDIMNQLTAGFEEMAHSVLPSPLEDEYLEAFDTNCAVSG
ncbi:hypothetical protein PIB30_009023 [Stylosanthes scabra]|uniref:Uncharacterized protein n=1 Tax=Stylosanthes scabra TaxID=79078 RepID=A0ABU6T5L0_9FABA|nr:hypothetical protein [Stylosanthes scabra]